MKNAALLCLLSISVAACSSNNSPLTESECKTIADKEAKYLANMFAKHPEMQASFYRLTESRTAQCAAGKSFDRAAYNCIMRASSDSAMDSCLRNGG